jgi:hypothetical protein
MRTHACSFHGDIETRLFATTSLQKIDLAVHEGWLETKSAQMVFPDAGEQEPYGQN